MGSDLSKRIVIFVAVLIVAIMFLLPTIFYGKIGTWISKPIALGLDLSGGAYIEYQVQTDEAVKSRLQGYATSLRADLRTRNIAVTRAKTNDRGELEVNLFSDRRKQEALDLVAKSFPELALLREEVIEGRPSIFYGMRPGDVTAIKKQSVEQALETLRNRIDQFGVAEPLIQRVGEERLLLQMPGVQDIDSLKRVIGSVAKLEFRLVPKDANSQYSVKLKEKNSAEIVTVEDEALMTGDSVSDARVAILEGKVEVSLSLTSDGSRTFRKITSENVGRQLAIVLDNVVYSAPVIRETISQGQASISGGFNLDEAKQLAIVLRAGALPAPLTILNEATVGPTLGRESIRSGIYAIIGGSLFVFLFMFIFYKKSGAVAVASLILNLFLILAALSAFGATLTLPGLAALALTVGVAVDSNVLIFERIKDELSNGAGRDAAVLGGFSKAFTAIFDANLTTLLSALILYIFGTGPVRGFAVTLAIGIVTTVFCAVFVCRLAFDCFQLKGKQVLSI